MDDTTEEITHSDTLESHGAMVDPIKENYNSDIRY